MTRQATARPRKRGSRFAGSIIPSSRINPVARNLLACYAPGSSLSSLPSNFSGNPRNTLDDDQGGLRVDASLTARQQLFGRILVCCSIASSELLRYRSPL